MYVRTHICINVHACRVPKDIDPETCVCVRTCTHDVGGLVLSTSSPTKAHPRTYKNQLSRCCCCCGGLRSLTNPSGVVARRYMLFPTSPFKMHRRIWCATRRDRPIRYRPHTCPPCSRSRPHTCPPFSQLGTCHRFVVSQLGTCHRVVV